jgi:type VI secretion system protein VasJ
MDLTELSSRPITSEAPAGSEARHTPEFEALQAEMDRLSCPSKAGSVDWDSIVRLSSTILRNTSKDLLAAGYLCLALVHTQGYPGCSAALGFYLEFLENFWEELYPPKGRAGSRMRALTWWLERMKSALILLPSPAGAEQSCEIRELLSRLERFLASKLDSPPSLVPLLVLFASPAPESASQELPAGETAGSITPEDPVGTAASPPPDAASEPALRQPPPTEEGWGSLDQGLSHLTTLLFQFREQEPAHPLPYRLLRQLTWSGVTSLPQAENGRTRIPAPPAHLKQVCTGLSCGQDAVSQLLAAERSLPQFIFWIDLNQVAAKALDSLGSRYQTAHDAVCQETAFLLFRLPGLAELSFSDGTPFVAPETRQWLDAIAIGTADSVAVNPVRLRSAEEVGASFEPGDELYRLFANGHLRAGLAAARKALGGTASGRDHLLCRLSISEALLQSGHFDLALPLLEQARHDIDHYRLEQYEPAVALKGLQLSWRALGRQPASPAKAEAQELLHRIGRLDLAEMAHLLQASPGETAAAQTGTAQP